MGAEFNWWLLIVGVVAGGGLTWLVLADFARKDREIDDEEVGAEASWIARTVDDPRLDAALAEDVLRAHRRYLGFPPPDALVPADELQGGVAPGIGLAAPSDAGAGGPVAPADDAPEGPVGASSR